MQYAYKRVSTDSEATVDGVESSSNLCNALLVAKDMLLTSLALFGVIAITFNIIYYHRHDEPSKDVAGYEIPRKSCYCGESTAEARERGCKYDSLCAAWLPEHCRDDELTLEFERSGDGADGNWLYWADKKHTQPLTLEQVAELGDHPNATFHMSGQWHVTHCFFFWRLEHRLRLNGKFVEGRSYSEKHVLHCQEVILHPQIGVMSGVTLDADV